MNLFTCLCVFASTPVFAPNYAHADTPAPDFNLTALQAHDPLLKEFADQHFAPDLSNVWEARELDDNPYLMRGQTYGAALADAGEDRSAFKVERDSLKVQVRGTTQTLEIDFPLAPLFELDEYLFFQPTRGDAFRERLADGDRPSEGLFFLRKRYVYDELKRAGERRPVPIFFLPLAGAWTGRVTHVVDQSSGTLALNNGVDSSATIGLDTLGELSKVLHLNLTLATVMALKNDPSAPDVIRRQLGRPGAVTSLELPFALPPPGSTFAFGTFFTGINLDRPDQGLFKAKARFSFDFSILPKAHALLAPDVLSSLMTTGMIMATAWTLGTLAQFTVLRPRLLERRALIEARRPSKDLGTRSYGVRVNLKENMDVLTNALMVLGSGFQTAGGHLAEYAFDRSGVRAAQSGWLRKALENTMITTRRWAEGVNVNAWVGFLGVVVLGGIGLGALSVQLLYLSPIVFPAIAGLVSPDLRARVASDFSGANAATNNLVSSEWMYNVAMSPQLAYAYAAEQRRVFSEQVKPRVLSKLIRAGKDPTDEALVDDEIQRQIEPMIVERGLPADDEFLFSSPSLVRSIAGLMGYKVSRAELDSSRDAVEGENPSFTLERARYGLTAHAVKDALRDVLELGARHPEDRNLAEAARILTEMQRRLHTLTAMMLDPRHAGRAWREGQSVRKILTLFTLEEPLVGAGLRFIDQWRPEDVGPLARLLELETEISAREKAAGRNASPRAVRRLMRARVKGEDPAVALALEHVGWRGDAVARRLAEAREESERGLLGAAIRNERAATLAGRAFRQRFFARARGQDELARPSLDDRVTFGAEARAQAIASLRAAPTGVRYGDADVEIETLEIIKQKVATRARAEAQSAWRPPDHGRLGRWQIARAHAAAEREIAYKILGEDPEVDRAYRDAFRRVLSRTVGLRASEDPARGAEYVVTVTAREAAEAELVHHLTENENVAAYLRDKTPTERVRFAAQQYADMFLHKYTELTVGNSAVVPLTSPAQPGFFQRARQTEFARRDNWLGRATTYALRVGDSMFDASATRPGLASWLYRRVPFARDFAIEGDMRWRAFPTFALISWQVNYYLWGVHFNLPTMAFFWVTGGLTSIAHYWVDRILNNVGVPPLGTIKSQAAYAVVLEAMTYFTLVPFFFFAQDFEKAVNSAWDGCQRILGGLTKR